MSSMSGPTQPWTKEFAGRERGMPATVVGPLERGALIFMVALGSAFTIPAVVGLFFSKISGSLLFSAIGIGMLAYAFRSSLRTSRQLQQFGRGCLSFGTFPFTPGGKLAARFKGGSALQGVAATARLTCAHKSISGGRRRSHMRLVHEERKAVTFVAGSADLSFDIPASAPGTAGPLGENRDQWMWSLEIKSDAGGPYYREVYPIPIYDPMTSQRALALAKRAEEPQRNLSFWLLIPAIAVFAVAAGSRALPNPQAALHDLGQSAEALRVELMRWLWGPEGADSNTGQSPIGATGTSSPSGVATGSAGTRPGAGSGVSSGSRFLEVDLGTSTTINKIVVRHAGAGGETSDWNTRDFSLEVSDSEDSADIGTGTVVATIRGNTADVTTHAIAATTARYVRLNVAVPTQTSDRAARIYELEVYGPDSSANLALNRPSTGSVPCNINEASEKAFNGSVAGNTSDKWCSMGGSSGPLSTVATVTGNTADASTIALSPVSARYVRLNVATPTQTSDQAARIYELAVYGPGSPGDLALRRPATGSIPCNINETAAKAFNGSVSHGTADKWCSASAGKFLEVDLGSGMTINRIVVQHAGAGRESKDWDTRDYNLQVSTY